MDKYLQLDWHKFIIETDDGTRELCLYGCQAAAEHDARETCEENGFEYVRYDGILRDEEDDAD